MEQIPFISSAPNTLGIELELQLIDPRSFDLTAASDELLAQMANHPIADRVKPEITRSMIELNSSVHEHPMGLLAEMREMRDALIEAADAVGVSVAGGGAHPFMRWQERSISDTPRFQYLAEMYGYLARQFTVFGQHIHIGVANGDDAMYLTHGLSRYVPHFIALSAASPFYQGVDTAFDSSRSNVVRAFPLAGTAPVMTKWSDFERYYDDLLRLGIIGSMKDFYWDIRPKPEYGTVEVRVCDTPLTLELAALLGCYAQLLSRWLLTERPIEIHDDFYLLYQYNRFEASRYGLDGEVAKPQGEQSGDSPKQSIYVDILDRLQDLQRFTQNEAEVQALKRLRIMTYERLNDAAWLRQAYKQRGSLNDVMRMSSELWMKHTAPPYFH